MHSLFVPNTETLYPYIIIVIARKYRFYDPLAELFPRNQILFGPNMVVNQTRATAVQRAKLYNGSNKLYNIT